jgi:hypothetical protein
MRSNLFPRTLFAALLLTAFAVAAQAQVTQVNGKVTLKQADGTVVPVVGAQIDIYRTDIKQEFHTKSDKKGGYIHAGLPFVGTYTVVVSAPNAQPSFAVKKRFTQAQQLDFELRPGDGSKLTLDQVNSLAASGGNVGSTAAATPAAGESKEAKAKREELDRKVKEIEAKNAEITKNNESIQNAFKAGNDALNANRLDDAITQYQAGLSARAEEPALLTNLSEALRRRGVARYNDAVKSADADAKNKGIEDAKKDWKDAADAAQKALQVINTGSADPQQQAIYAQNKNVAISTRALALALVARKVDPTQAQAAWEAYQEYIAIETDATKKAKLKGDALQTLFDASALDLATTQARAVLAEDPENVDANRILGLALFSSGDKAKFQEAANYLQRYVDKAPDTDPLKQSAKESLDYLKTAENVKPEKVTPTRPARRRP